MADDGKYAGVGFALGFVAAFIVIFLATSGAHPLYWWTCIIAHPAKAGDYNQVIKIGKHVFNNVVITACK